MQGVKKMNVSVMKIMKRRLYVYLSCRWFHWGHEGITVFKKTTNKHQNAYLRKCVWMLTETYLPEFLSVVCDLQTQVSWDGLRQHLILFSLEKKRKDIMIFTNIHMKICKVPQHHGFRHLLICCLTHIKYARFKKYSPNYNLIITTSYKKSSFLPDQNRVGVSYRSLIDMAVFSAT